MLVGAGVGAAGGRLCACLETAAPAPATGHRAFPSAQADSAARKARCPVARRSSRAYRSDTGSLSTMIVVSPRRRANAFAE